MVYMTSRVRDTSWPWSRANDRKYFLSLLMQCHRKYHHSHPLGRFFALATLSTLFQTKMAVVRRSTTHNQCDRRGKWRSDKSLSWKAINIRWRYFTAIVEIASTLESQKLATLTKPWLIKYSAKYTRNKGIMYCIRDYKERQRTRTLEIAAHLQS